MVDFIQPEQPSQPSAPTTPESSKRKPIKRKIPPSAVVSSPIKPIGSSAVRSDASGLSPFPATPMGKMNWFWARHFVIQLQTRYMQDVLKDENMPSYSAVNAWMERYPKFKEWVLRSRRMFADVLAERSASMFDEKPPMEVLQTKNGSYERISMSGVQRERYKSQAMFNLAAKFNPDQYGEKMQVSGSFNLIAAIASTNGKRIKPVIDTSQTQSS
jgi:hypothetical protein